MNGTVCIRSYEETNCSSECDDGLWDEWVKARLPTLRDVRKSGERQNIFTQLPTISDNIT
jgi:hypothetical protein